VRVIDAKEKEKEHESKRAGGGENDKKKKSKRGSLEKKINTSAVTVAAERNCMI